MTENKTKQQVFNYTKKDTIVPYVVKRINNRLYVYRQFRAGRKVISEYIGPFEKIVEFYLENFQKLQKGKVVDRAGFEPATPRLRTGYSSTELP